MIPTNSPLNGKRLCPNVNYGIELNSDDLLTEILLRLPVKSLSRFKSVCKRWLSIISSDHFCHQHTLRRPRLQPSLLLQMNNYGDFFYLDPTTNGEEKMIPYKRSFPLCGCTIVLACNGLMLLQYGCNDDYLSNDSHYYVYNLTTRKYRNIALNRKNDDEYLRAGIGLGFDPSKSPYYKIVCIYTSYRKEDRSSYDDELMTSYQIEVYDSESHSWKLGSESASIPKLCSIHGTHWNNKIYWPTRGSGYCYFDVDKNEMKTLSFSDTGRLVLPRLQESDSFQFGETLALV